MRLSPTLMRKGAATLAVGTELAVAVATLTALGQALDQRFGLEPVFTLTGALLGLVIGVSLMLRRLRQLEQMDESEQ